MSQAIVFVSTCPSCNSEQLQDAFTVAALARLLEGGHPIEAYCTICEAFWPVSLQKRVELGQVIAVTCEGTSLLKGSEHRTEQPFEDSHK